MTLLHLYRKNLYGSNKLFRLYYMAVAGHLITLCENVFYLTCLRYLIDKELNGK